MNSWSSYPKLYNLGHARIQSLLAGPVRIEEKIDGSQFSFGMFNGQLKVKSKNVEMELSNVPKLFKPTVETAVRLFNEGLLTEGYTYRGEAMYGPKHNTLAYERAPKNNIILFDVATGLESYGDRALLELEAARMGLEVVPCFFEGVVTNLDHLRTLMATKSILGDVAMEGIVIKGDQFVPEGKPMFGKLVSDTFKESHNKEWKNKNPSGTDIIQDIAMGLKTTARWDKSIQKMRDSGTLTESPQDIGPLIQSIAEDVKDELEEEIKQMLFNWAWKKMYGKFTAGFPQYYKAKLAEKAFELPEVRDGTN